jgi:hypothetical protein
MSNALYEKFCLASLPKELTPLDRQLLGHYCLRFNSTLKPPKAYPGMPELIGITKVLERSILRSRARLVKQGYLYKITPGKHRSRSEFGVNEGLIEKFIRVIEESPLIDERFQGHDLLTAGSAIGDPEVSNGSPKGHPKSIERNISKESKTFDLTRFELIVKGLPTHLRALVNPGLNFERLLNELELQGTSQEAIREYLQSNSWINVRKPGGIVATLLQQLLTANAARIEPALPDWCGWPECDEETRKVPVAWLIPGGDGATTFACPRCSRFAMTRGLIDAT